MYKFIIILILLIILFYMFRRAVRDWGQDSSQQMPGKDVMIQDPVCKVYITAGTAVTERVGGQTYYFCSQDCADRFRKGSG